MKTGPFQAQDLPTSSQDMLSAFKGLNEALISWVGRSRKYLNIQDFNQSHPQYEIVFMSASNQPELLQEKGWKNRFSKKCIHGQNVLYGKNVEGQVVWSVGENPTGSDSLKIPEISKSYIFPKFDSSSSGLRWGLFSGEMEVISKIPRITENPIKGFMVKLTWADLEKLQVSMSMLERQLSLINAETVVLDNNPKYKALEELWVQQGIDVNPLLPYDMDKDLPENSVLRRVLVPGPQWEGREQRFLRSNQTLDNIAKGQKNLKPMPMDAIQVVGQTQALTDSEFGTVVVLMLRGLVNLQLENELKKVRGSLLGILGQQVIESRWYDFKQKFEKWIQEKAYHHPPIWSKEEKALVLDTLQTWLRREHLSEQLREASLEGTPFRTFSDQFQRFVAHHYSFHHANSLTDDSWGACVQTWNTLLDIDHQEAQKKNQTSKGNSRAENSKVTPADWFEHMEEPVPGSFNAGSIHLVEAENVESSALYDMVIERSHLRCKEKPLSDSDAISPELPSKMGRLDIHKEESSTGVRYLKRPEAK